MGLCEGAVLGDGWRLDVQVGHGGMATVWAATHRSGGRGAVKILHPHLASEPTIGERFRREAYVANAIAHEGVVRVIDDGVLAEGSLFIVMDLLHGATVDARRREAGGRLAADEVAPILAQLLDLLDVAHGSGVVHRDIKPANLFLEAGGKLRVLDFGIARILDAGEGLTRTGAFLGTPAFMAPEQAIAASEVDARADLWSAAATAFFLLTGEYVHDAQNTNALLNALLSRAPRSLAEVLPGAPAALVRVIDGALRRDRSERWPDAASMRAELGPPSARSSSRSVSVAELEADAVTTELEAAVTTELEAATQKLARRGPSAVTPLEGEAPTVVRDAAPVATIIRPLVAPRPLVWAAESPPAKGGWLAWGLGLALFLVALTVTILALK